MTDMPKWPIELGGYPIVEDQRDYHHARAEAAIARLKVAVEALQVVALCDPDVSDELVARSVLRIIGPIP